MQCLAKAGLASVLRPQFHFVPSLADPYDDVGRVLLVPASEWNRTVATCQPRSAGAGGVSFGAGDVVDMSLFACLFSLPIITHTSSPHLLIVVQTAYSWTDVELPSLHLPVF